MEPWHRENIFSVGEVSLNPLIEFFSKYTKVGIISISIVLLKIENKGEIIISDIIFNLVCPSQSQFFIRINLVGKGLEVFLHQKSYRNGDLANFGYITSYASGTYLGN